jgi:hypothetical protein
VARGFILLPPEAEACRDHHIIVTNIAAASVLDRFCAMAELLKERAAYRAVLPVHFHSPSPGVPAGPQFPAMGQIQGLSTAVPVIWPLLSRNVVVPLLSRVAVPVIRPELSRNV